VRFQGQAIAAVIAATRAEEKDACDAMQPTRACAATHDPAREQGCRPASVWRVERRAEGTTRVYAPDVLFLRDWLGALQISGGSLPDRIATGILALIERLQPGDGLDEAFALGGRRIPPCRHLRSTRPMQVPRVPPK